MPASYTSPQDLANQVCEIAHLKCGRPTEPTSVLQSLMAHPDRTHHRAHGDCPFAELERMDPILAAQVRAMALKYGYPSPQCPGSDPHDVT